MISLSPQLSTLDEMFTDLAGAALPGRSGWEVMLPGDTRVEAHVVDSWLVMTAHLPTKVTPLQLLGGNARLPAWVKFAIDEMGAPQMRAEIPLEEALEGGADLHEVVDGFQIARSIIDGHGGAAAPSVIFLEPTPAELKSLCDEAGWTALARGSNAVVVELECRGAFHQALLAPVAGGLRVTTEFAALDHPTTEVVDAVALFLIDVAAEVRMVRPVLEMAAGKAAPRFEFVFSATPSVALLGHAFAALSMACRVGAEEVKALLHGEVAHEYLGIRGGLRTGPTHSAN